ncbi:eukaryotic translation initiation factor 5B-like isoform X2 [Branchiostoma floridae]|uniref:Eukaryotic translation initiation factor 5B n=1 Tax=Branchiostoma floridae TaxID=7739 RepID=A0A9J7LDJ3_BRAFL|nr:eukaryotic translation initiation factor 5B-like isoform X2 [Branchiostoma floridae]
MGKKKGKKTQDQDIDVGEDGPGAGAADNIDDLVAEIEGSGPKAAGGKKSKKKGKKKDDDWEDDLLEEMEALSMGVEGTGKPADKPKEPQEETQEEKSSETTVPNGTVPQATDTPEGDKEEAKETTEKDTEEAEDTGPTVKTAAQKKAEKKEREKKKKEEQKKKERAKKEAAAQKAGGKKEEETEKTEEGKDEDKAETSIPEEGAAKEEEGAEGEGADEGTDKKKKKKKKKGEKEEKEEKRKGPSKAMVKAMQEALRIKQEEEERLKREEEERIRKLEEAEEARREQERLEKEKREKKKQKEKERKERLKKEGKLLTAAQKQQRKRAEEMLEAMRAQGFDVPSKDEIQKKPVRYGSKGKNKKKEKVENQEPTVPTEEAKEQEEVKDTAEVTAEGEAVQQEEEQAAEGEEEEEEEEELDTWEEMLSDDEAKKEEKAAEKEQKEASEKAPDTKEAAPTVEKEKQVSRQESKETEEDEEEEEEEEDEDDEEEESESESESESEEDLWEASLSPREVAMARIAKRKEQAEKKKTTDNLRSPVVVVLGHVDTGKTKILDKIRHTHVQDGEAGGITQQIGATMVPVEAIREQAKMVRKFSDFNIKLPGLLIIDTPGHESFSNLRSRGSSLCDIAILVVDIMHGLEPQTIESLNLLKARKTPFVIALNKIDRLYEWKPSPNTDVRDTIKKQKRNTKDEFDERVKVAVTEFAEQSMNVALFYENKDPKTFVSMVPTSAHSGDGMGNLMGLIVELSQTLLAKRLAFSESLQCTTLEVKQITGLGTTIDVILVNGRLHEGETIVVAGQEGPIVTQVRSLLMPQPLKELRVKNKYETHKEIIGAQGVKVLAKDLDRALAGTPLLVAYKEDEVDICKEEVARILKQTLETIRVQERGVYVQASTLGSLEALLEFLKTSKIPFAGINIGPVHKKDVMKASIMLEHDSQYAVILAFDVRVERDAQELADSLGIRIFTADIIYHLFDSFMKYRDDMKKQKQEELRHVAIFPCKLRILPNCVFNSRDPIVVGVNVEAGVVRQGSLICVKKDDKVLDLGVVTSLEVNHKQVDMARKGSEVCVKIENPPGETPKLFGRHFDEKDILLSKISREGIDAIKDWFREDMTKTDWQLMIELKKVFQIM